MYTDEIEDTKNDTPALVEAFAEKEPMEEEPSAKPSPKSQEKVVNGSMYDRDMVITKGYVYKKQGSEAI